MENCVKAFLMAKGYTVNDKAMDIIRVCDDWYANRETEFHCRHTVQGTPYELNRLNFAKRCCADDANLCEIIEINAGTGGQNDKVQEILKASRFQTQYRKQLEQTSAHGTVACYIRVDNATIMDDGTAHGGKIRLNYVSAESFLPLTVEDDVVIEAAFSGSGLQKGEKRTTLVMFTLDEAGRYTAETHVFDKVGTEIPAEAVTVQLGDVKPFGVMRIAETNNLDNMLGYGLPKLWNAIPMFKALDLCFHVLFGDLDKADKLVLINEALCKFDENGQPITPNEQIKKIFVMLGEKLPEGKDVIEEYNPIIRIDEITKSFELTLSLLSMMFGYGTKKYSFENGQITTATQYIGERQDQMQELNRQRQEATEYIRDICRAVLWFSNTYQGTAFDVDSEILVEFDDSYISDRETELERKRNDATTFDIPELLIWYLMDAYTMTEDEAKEIVLRQQETEKTDTDGEAED
ncbi:MAG: phage portal protein [Muribaculum sp.]|nr:phage portal protein [Muribaculum sp.]